MKPFEDLLVASAEAHGHLCPGQVVGVRLLKKAKLEQTVKVHSPMNGVVYSGRVRPH
jgi:formylmethanofuran dehydrogenase subunit E